MPRTRSVAGVALATIVAIVSLACWMPARAQSPDQHATPVDAFDEQRLTTIDSVTCRWLDARAAWPWISPSPSDSVDAVLAGRAKVAIAYAGIVGITVISVLLLPGAALFRRTRRGRGVVGALLVAAIALAVLACVEYGTAIGPSAEGLGAWRILRLALMVLIAVAHAGVVGGAIRATIASAVMDGAVGSAKATTAATDDSSKEWAPQFRARMCNECVGIMAARPTPPPDAPAPTSSASSRCSACPDLRVPTAPTSAGEPFISFRAGDLTGVALSGGGIRSATFALGVLQGLNRVGLLNKFDYLSTVSGGGYIGSFWSAWLARRSLSDRPVDAREFPTVLDPRPPRADVESHQVRHLREFGNFLAPRLGLFEVETWTIVVAVLSGLIPAVLTALSVIGMVLLVWLVTTVPLASSSAVVNALMAALVTAVVLYHFERRWQLVKLPRFDRHVERERARKRDLWLNVGFSGAGVAAVIVLTMLCTPVIGESIMPGTGTWDIAGRLGMWVWSQPETCAGITPGTHPLVYLNGCWREVDNWWTLAGLTAREAPTPGSTTYWFASPSLLTYPLVWLVAALVLVALRQADALIPSKGPSEYVAPLDRTIMRLLGLGVFGIAIVVLWHLIVNLDQLMATAMLTVTSAGGFTLLRNWLTRIGRTPAAPGTTSALKEAVPQLLAYLTLLLAAAGVGQLLVTLCRTDWFAWWQAFAAMSFVLVGGLFIDPGRFGLHAFYRSRISRAYAGASNLHPEESAADNRVTEARPDDDLVLTDLPPRPLHLICCAANDLSGDAVGTLGRNGRSAVLSRHGLSIGPFAGPTPGLTLGAAVTASAAAFNSNMGDVSTRFGPAVTFLMTALNLRLGLWVRHPKAEPEQPRRWPGLLLYRELFGLTSASGEVPGRGIPSHLRDLHLSDGGHFENLAIYELVRRHCRYILVCDSGADPTVAFDDLGRALRRIRQDFGVDISIDVEALRPDQDGLSKQHVAVGRIHYSPTDAGILLYVKPTLTGDEPADVLQYKGRNHDFPHEGTGDQFYDEAQWESYRRLGLHVADTIFDFIPPGNEPASGTTSAEPAASVERAPEDDTPAGGAPDSSVPAGDRQEKGEKVTADYAFAEAAHRWGPTPPGLGDRVLEMTKRVIDLETDLKSAGTTVLLAEVFPELGYVPGSGLPEPNAREACTELVTILRVTQVMEDVWLACSLDRWWAHPLNMGWTNFFARWATAPVFRFWWPVMGPMYSKGFRDFLDERFPLPAMRTQSGDRSGRPWQGIVQHMTAAAPNEGLAKEWWAHRSAQPCPWLSPGSQPDSYFENIISGTRAETRMDLQVGLAAVWKDMGAALWTSDDFFVPPSLWGASIGWHFLEGILNDLACDRTLTLVYVAVVKDTDGDAHRMALDDRRSFVDQYRKIGFRQVLRDQHGAFPGAADTLLRRRRILGTDSTRDRQGYGRIDALLELDLDAWASRRGWRSTREARRLPS